jgi:hypothetical protein
VYPVADDIRMSMVRAEEEARKKASETLRDLDNKHAAISERMSESLRYLTVNEQRRMEQTQLLRQYYPEYGKEAGFREGTIGGAGAIAGGYGAFRLSRAMGHGSIGMAVMAGMGAIGGYGLGRIGAEESAGTMTSITGLKHQDQLNRLGPMAVYAARGDWQNFQGSVPGPEYFKSSIGAPASAIAESFGLNPSQFLPGALDLMSEGIVASGSASPGRSVRDALKESAEIFKAIQAFFGTVDIAGLTGKIKQLQAAGFTPSSMTEMGRAMQRSTLAFAPEHIRELVQSMVTQSGAAFSGMGLSASLGGQSAIAGFESAFSNFGKLSDYERSVFRTQEQLGQTLTGIMGAPLSNPFLMMGGGNASRGLDRIARNFDLASPGGIRDYKKALFEVSSNIGMSEQVGIIDNGVESMMEMFPGTDRETAAQMFFQDDEKAMAYMVQYRGRGDTLARNVGMFGKMKVSGFMNRDQMESALTRAADPRMRLGGISAINASGGQGSMLRHMIRMRSYGGTAVTAAELAQGDTMFGVSTLGYIDRRALSRLWNNVSDVPMDWADANIMSMFGKGSGEDMYSRFLNRSPMGARQLADETASVIQGYETASSSGVSSSDVKEALRTVTSSAGSSRMMRVLTEEMQTSGRGMDYNEMAGLASSMGMNDVAAVLRDPSKRGEFMRGLEQTDNRMATVMSRSMFGSSSLDNVRRLRADMNAPVFREIKGGGTLASIGSILSNPITSTATGLVFGVAATALTAATGLGALAAGAKFFGIGMMGSQMLGAGFTALGGLSASGVSKEMAQKLNNEAYGVEAVVMSIVGTFPEDMFSMFKAQMLYKPEDRVEAAHGAAVAIYGKASQLYAQNPDMKETDMMQAVYTHVLASLSGISQSNGYADVLIEHYRRNGAVFLGKAIGVILSYLSGVESPETPGVIADRVREKVQGASRGWLTSVNERKEIEAYRLMMKDGSTFDQIKARAGTTREEGVRASRSMEDMSRVIKENIRSASGAKVTTAEDIQKVTTAINRGMAGIKPEDAGDRTKVEEAAGRALAEAGYTAGEGGMERLIHLMEGVYTKSDKSMEMSTTAKRILEDILSDPGISGKLRNIFGAQLTT